MNAEIMRKAVPLSAEELVALDAARTPGHPAHQALAELAGVDPGRSEAATLKALVQLGLRAVEEKSLDSGYAALALVRAGEEDQEYKSAARVRRERRHRGDD